MSDLRKIAAVAALSAGLNFSEDGYSARAGKLAVRPAFLPAPPEPLSKRQRRRLRGKQLAKRTLFIGEPQEQMK